MRCWSEVPSGVNVGETQSLQDAGRFVRLRDELQYTVREWFAALDVCIPNDPVLISELSAPSYKLTSSGKISVETKDELKARGLKSPNAADALALTFAVSDHGERSLRQTHAIGSSYDVMASAAVNAANLANEERRRVGGYWSGPGWAPTWVGDDQTQQYGID